MRSEPEEVQFVKLWDELTPALLRIGEVLFDDPRLRPAVNTIELIRASRQRSLQTLMYHAEVHRRAIERVVVGDMLGCGLDRYHHSLRGVISAQVWNEEAIEEIVQGAALRAVERLDELIDRPRRLFNWLCQLVQQQRVDWLRARSAQKRDAGRTQALTEGHSVIGDGTTPTHHERRLRVREMFERVLTELPEDAAAILRWHLNEQLEPSEMADRLAITVGNARVRLFRARRDAFATWIRLYPDSANELLEFGILKALPSAPS